MSNNLDPDQGQRFVGPDLGQNCSQWLSADSKSHRYQGKSLDYTESYPEGPDSLVLRPQIL